MSQSTNAIAAAHPRDLLDRARQILHNANCEGRDLSDLEMGRVDEILDIVSLAIDRKRSASVQRNHRRATARRGGLSDEQQLINALNVVGRPN